MLASLALTSATMTSIWLGDASVRKPAWLFPTVSKGVPTLPQVRVSALGHLVVEVDGEAKRLTPTSAVLLIRLLLAEGQAVRLEQLYRDVWWKKKGPGVAVGREERTQVQRVVGQLRALLDPQRPGKSSQVIVMDHTASTAYRLILSRVDVDLFNFRDLADALRDADPATTVRLATRALAMWRGRPLSDVDEFPFAVNAQQQYTQLRAIVQRRLLRAYVLRHMTSEARMLAEQLRTERPNDPDIVDVLGELYERPSERHRILLQHSLDEPKVTITLAAGDLFASDESDLVIGFSDTFDTSTDDDLIISSRTAQGQLLHRLYDGDRHRLDQDLRRALSRLEPVGHENRRDKPHGKRVRYPIGTIAVLRQRGRRLFCVAYSRMSNELVARSSVEHLTLSLERLWESAHRYGQFAELTMPLIGSGLSRIHTLDYQELLRLILTSFRRAATRLPICRELRIVLHPSQMEKIDVEGIAADLLQPLPAEPVGAGTRS